MCEYPQSDIPPKVIKKFFLLDSKTMQDVTVQHICGNADTSNKA